MRLVISKDGVKREIETPFALCCGRDDLGALIKHLQSVHAGALDTSYGWFRIDPSHPEKDGPEGAPLKWTDR